MSKPSTITEPTGFPEFGVRAEVIGRFFSPPLASSTFHDFVNKGKITRLKGVRGFYKLNDSLSRLGLREVRELPRDAPSRTSEDIIRLAFHAIDPELFPAPAWLLDVEAIDAADLHHAEQIFARHSSQVADLTHDRLKIAYLQGVIDMAMIVEADHQAGPE